jgi:transposase
VQCWQSASATTRSPLRAPEMNRCSRFSRPWSLGSRTRVIAPHRRNKKNPKTREGHKLRRYKRRWKLERLFAWLSNFQSLVVCYERRAENYLGFVRPGCMEILLKYL